MSAPWSEMTVGDKALWAEQVRAKDPHMARFTVAELVKYSIAISSPSQWSQNPRRNPRRGTDWGEPLRQGLVSDFGSRFDLTMHLMQGMPFKVNLILAA